MKHKILLIISVVLISFAAIFVKLLNVEPSVIAMYRLGIGGLLLLPFALRDQNIKTLKFKDLKLFILAGLVISLHYFSWFTSLRLTSVTSSTLIICTEPLVALAFGYALYREKISKKQFLVLLIALVGVGIVAWGDIYLSTQAIVGDALTLLAVVFFVIYLMIGQQVVKKYSFIIYTALLFLCAAFILLIYNLIMGYQIFDFFYKEWILFVLIAIIPNAGQVIINYILNYVKSSLIATSILLEPIFASILALFILQDVFYINQLLGGIIIIFSVFIYIRLE